MQVDKMVELVTSDEPPLRHTVDDIIASGERVQRRQRLVWTGGAAAVTALAVTAAILVPQVVGRSSGQPAGIEAGAAAPTAPASFPQPSGRFTFTLKAYDVGGYHVGAPTVVSAAYQRAPVFKDGATMRVGDQAYPRSVAELVVYRPNMFKPDRLTAPERFTIAGRPALKQAIPVKSVFPDKPKNKLGDGVINLVAWQYADNAWATLEANGYKKQNLPVPMADLAKIAAGLAGGGQRPARLPFTLDKVPPGYQPAEVAVSSFLGSQVSVAQGEAYYGGVLLTSPPTKPGGLTRPWEYGVDGIGGLRFEVMGGTTGKDWLSGKTPPTKPLCMQEFVCHAWSSDGKLKIELVSDGKVPNKELIRLLNGVTFADVDNPETWPLVTAALPGTGG